MASSEFEGGRHSEAGMEMIRLLEQVLRNSRAVDREALCVLAGQKVRSWCAAQCKRYRIYRCSAAMSLGVVFVCI